MRFPLRGYWAACLLVYGLLLSACGSSADAPSDTPERTVRSFYKAHFESDMGFSEENIARHRAWFDPELHTAIEAYFDYPVVPDEPPPINGDPFTDSQDYPDDYDVGSATVNGDRAVVPVTFKWPDAPRVVTVALVRRDNRWLITDFRYEDSSTLRGLLIP